MSIPSKFTALVAIAAIGLGTSPALQAQTQVRAAQQASPETQAQARTEHCAKVEVHLNELGMAFACYKQGNEPVMMIAVHEQGFANRVDYVWEMLNSATEYATGSTRGSHGIHAIVDRGTDPRSRSICARTRALAGNLPCYKALNLTKR